jgi:hypothetical protein
LNCGRSYEHWNQSYDHELQCQRCKFYNATL